MVKKELSRIEKAAINFTWDEEWKTNLKVSQWEYKYTRLDDRINELGAAGWELVSVKYTDEGDFGHFKRDKNEWRGYDIAKKHMDRLRLEWKLEEKD